MKKCSITVVKMAHYDDLMKKYENPIEHACNMKMGQTFMSIDGQKPDGFCDSAWESMEYFVKELARGGGNFYDGWMKNPQSAMISCNDGFRPVSFYIEVIDEMEYKILNDINDEIRDLRVRTFVIGRGVPEEIEIDGKDPYLLHFCIYDDEKLLAYLRAEDIGDMLHIGRVCVENSIRKQGLGRKLLEFLESYARDKGFSAIELSAVDTAVGFYEKCGFHTEGDYYEETGVPHIYMKKTC